MTLLKKCTTLLPVILISCASFAQNWAPVGAEWYYEMSWAWGNDIGYRILYCDSVVNIKGKNCQKINIGYCTCNTHFCPVLYSYESNDTVYFYNPDFDTFEVLYNFNAQAGDQWLIRTKDWEGIIDTVTIRVDSVGSIQINGTLLKKLFVTYYYRYKWPDQNWINSYSKSSKIIEQIGDLFYPINIDEKVLAICDLDFLYSLRCYEDSVLGLYSTGFRDSCTYVGLPADPSKPYDNISAYPNPAHDIIRVNAGAEDQVYYQLLSAKGIRLQEGKGLEINLSAFSNGLYFLRLIINNEFVKTMKVIRQ